MLGNGELTVRNTELVQQLEKRRLIMRLLSARSLHMLSVADTCSFGRWDVSGEGERETGIVDHPIQGYAVRILSLRLAELFLKSWD